MDTSIKFIKKEKFNLNKFKESTHVDIKHIYYFNNVFSLLDL